jgi:hypothetical protein
MTAKSSVPCEQDKTRRAKLTFAKLGEEQEEEKGIQDGECVDFKRCRLW